MISRPTIICLSVLCVLLFGISIAATAGATSSSGCFQANAVNVPGLKDYQVATCCSKGCGGKCCRCGSAVGYKPGCTDRCSVAHSDTDTVLVSLPGALRVQGRLVHAESGLPLANEAVSLKVPGHPAIEAWSDRDGRFVLDTSPHHDNQFAIVDVGEHPSVSAREREVDEAPVYRFFLSRQQAVDFASLFEGIL